MYKLAPSLLAADFGIIKEQLAKLDEAKVPYLHLDIMDGVFVPNLSFGLAVVESIRKYTKMVFDVHLMIIEPERYVEQFAKAGTDIFCFHIEATKDAKATVDKIKKCGMKAAIAVKPATPISEIKDLLGELDMVLVMTVEPGFGGQKFMEDQMEKVKELVKLREENNYKYDIEVDVAVIGVQPGLLHLHHDIGLIVKKEPPLYGIGPGEGGTQVVRRADADGVAVRLGRAGSDVLGPAGRKQDKRQQQGEQQRKTWHASSIAADARGGKPRRHAEAAS